MYNKKRKEKNIMGKSRNEVNGVLVYRRWCAGAILSAIVLLLIIAVPVAAIVFNWLVIKVPADNSIGYTGANTITLTGLDLVKTILRKETFPAQELINKIAASDTCKVKFFGTIMKASIYGMFGFLALIGLFGVIELIFFLFYLLTGRVVSPAAPVKLAWTLFVLVLVFGIFSAGLALLMGYAYSTAGGAGWGGILVFLLASILPRSTGAFAINFFWPLAYILVALIGAIIISIIYAAAFKDKFYIGRAKRFGSGETSTTERYETTHIYTNGTSTSATNSGQPQVIVVNSGPAPAPAGAPIIATIPGQQQPVVIQTNGQPVQPVNAAPTPENPEVPAAPVTVLPSDLKSIGGHAFSKNLDLKYADIPVGIKELGVGAFANCLNLEIVSIPKSVKRIKKNCFFNCVKLTRINYAGTKNEWRYIVRGSNWLDKAGTKTVVCSDGAIIVDPHR